MGSRPKQLSGFFENYMRKDPLFVNKKALQGNYTPDTIPHRDEQIQQIAGILAPALRMEKPSNIFLYGRTGTGKTVVSQYVADQLMKTARKKNINLQIVYLNCKMKRVADTEYRLLAQLANSFGAKVPATGLPTDEIDEVRWITKDQLSEQKIFPVCLLALETYFKRKTAT